MTLVVAGIAQKTGWIVSDTLITGGPIGLRDREYQIKCLPSHDRHALIAFSGDAHNGYRLIEQAASMPSGYQVVRMLREAQDNHPNIDFIYMFKDNDGPHLYKICGGHDSSVTFAYIGSKDAFEQFQYIRHNAKIDPPQKSLEAFVLGIKTQNTIPDTVSDVTVSMLRLFLQGAERDVGGWAVPYVMVPNDVYMCDYLYVVSDPIFDVLTPGAIVPDGTAEAGGYGLAVTEIGQLDGMVVYFRQLPGGLVLIRDRDTTRYKTVSIAGEPAEFCTKAASEIGQPVSIFFGGSSTSPLEIINVFYDDQDKPAAAIAKRTDNSFSFSILNLRTEFTTKGHIDFQRKKNAMTVENIEVTLADDKSHVILKLLSDGKVVGQSTLTASELDAVISGIGRIRPSLSEQVSREPDYTRFPELVVIDPAWRTSPSPHADADGIIMRLRHVGVGWVSFLLPRHEGLALGKWLTENSSEQNTRGSSSAI